MTLSREGRVEEKIDVKVGRCTACYDKPEDENGGI